MDQLSGDFKDMLRRHRHTFLRYALLTEQNRRDKLTVYRQNEDVAQLTERLLDNCLDRLHLKSDRFFRVVAVEILDITEAHDHDTNPDTRLGVSLFHPLRQFCGFLSAD